ncbi:hypothetical protein HOG21_00245 [bacterium]|nr:hypothetical protein [bacterium]
MNNKNLDFKNLGFYLTFLYNFNNCLSKVIKSAEYSFAVLIKDISVNDILSLYFKYISISFIISLFTSIIFSVVFKNLIKLSALSFQNLIEKILHTS